MATLGWADRETPEIVATGLLIAAAPDLLAALVEAERWVAKLAADAPEAMVGTGAILWRVQKKIRAALEKAEGPDSYVREMGGGS